MATASTVRLKNAAGNIITSFTMGDIITVEVLMEYATYSHTITFTWGSSPPVTGNVGPGVWPAGVNRGTWTLDTSQINAMAQKIPTSVTGLGRIDCITYLGAIMIGTTSLNFNATVPATMVPSGNLSITGLNLLYSDHYVQGKSQIQGNLTDVSGIQGSHIDSVTLNVGSQSTTLATAGPVATITSPLITQSGSVYVDAVITDSRGRIAVATGTYLRTFYRYNPPSVIATVTRCNIAGDEDPSEGQYIKVGISGGLSDVNHDVSKAFRVYYRNPAAAEPWGSHVWSFPIDPTGLTSLNSFYQFTDVLDNMTEYEARASITDAYETVFSDTIILTTPYLLMDFDSSGKGLAIGTPAIGPNIFQIGGPSVNQNTQMAVNINDVSTGNALTVGGDVLINANAVINAGDIDCASITLGDQTVYGIPQYMGLGQTPLDSLQTYGVHRNLYKAACAFSFTITRSGMIILYGSTNLQNGYTSALMLCARISMRTGFQIGTPDTPGTIVGSSTNYHELRQSIAASAYGTFSLILPVSLVAGTYQGVLDFRHDTNTTARTVGAYNAKILGIFY